MGSEAMAVVEAYLSAVDTEGIEKAARFLSNALSVEGFTLNPINKNTYIAALRMIHSAIPDSRAIIIDICAHECVVSATLQRGGIHTQTLDLSSIGGPTISPSYQPVTLPAEYMEYTVTNGKITRICNAGAPAADAGVSAVVKAFGITLPNLPVI